MGGHAPTTRCSAKLKAKDCFASAAMDCLRMTNGISTKRKNPQQLDKNRRFSTSMLQEYTVSHTCGGEGASIAVVAIGVQSHAEPGLERPRTTQGAIAHGREPRSGLVFPCPAVDAGASRGGSRCGDPIGKQAQVIIEDVTNGPPTEKIGPSL